MIGALMRVARVAPAELVEPAGVAVVFDVLRATSTAAVLLERVPRVAVTAREGLAALDPAAWLVVSELDETRSLPHRIDNSPRAAAEVALDGRTPLLVTTNGTRALLAAAARANRVLVASFRNLAATAALLQRKAPPLVTLLPAGRFQPVERHAEDDACADALAALLEQRPFDLPAALAALRSDERILRRLEREPLLAGDLELCLEADRSSRALEFVAGAASASPAGWPAGWIERCG